MEQVYHYFWLGFYKLLSFGVDSDTKGGSIAKKLGFGASTIGILIHKGDVTPSDWLMGRHMWPRFLHGSLLQSANGSNLNLSVHFSEKTGRSSALLWQMFNLRQNKKRWTHRHQYPSACATTDQTKSTRWNTIKHNVLHIIKHHYTPLNTIKHHPTPSNTIKHHHHHRTPLSTTKHLNDPNVHPSLFVCPPSPPHGAVRNGHPGRRATGTSLRASRSRWNTPAEFHGFHGRENNG